MEFLPEHWNIIKSYVGVYHIRTDWDLLKLDNNILDHIISWVSPRTKINIRHDIIEERIKFIWKHLNKSKLYDVDRLLKKYMING